MEKYLMDATTESSQGSKHEVSQDLCKDQEQNETESSLKKLTNEIEITAKVSEGVNDISHNSKSNGPALSINETKECSDTNIGVQTKEIEKIKICQENILDNPTSSTNGLENEEKLKRSPEPESELENSNSFQEKMYNNSKDSSMLSTTDTQDEIDTIDNGDQIFINHINDKTEEASQNDRAKQQMLEMEMESEDSLEEMLGSDLDPQTEETFSIVSGSEYDEASQGSVLEKSNDVILLETDGPATNGNKTPNAHEIEKDGEEDDDCKVTSESKTIENNKSEDKKGTELRRSSRTIKRKKYSYDNMDEESDIEELADEPFTRKSRPIMINDTKSLVEIAAKQAARCSSGQRREPQLVLIGSSPTVKTATPNRIMNSSINSSLYQSIVARGTSVTPVVNKQSTATQASQTTQTSHLSQPAILPSLTDDMFVVEAPSFIVPYVYEKPSLQPFKEFVVNLGKELEEQRAKAEKELMERKKEEKAKRQKERQEKRDRGEEVEDSDEEARRELQENRKRKLEKKEQRRRQKEEDDESWDGSDSSDSDDFKITDEDGTTIVVNDKDESIEDTKSDLEIVPVSTPKSENYFECTLGKFFMNIGMGLVEEYVQADLLKQQKRKLQREKKSGQSTKEREHSITLLKKNLELSKENNEPYTCSQLKCEHCTFKTESALVLAQHLETPHMKNNLYKCNFCEFEIRSPHDILFHMEAEHNVRGKLERAPSYHQCANCPFEDNGKGKLARHLIACAKKFKPEQNLSPPVEWEPPAKIPKVAKARNTMLGSPLSTAGPYSRPQMGGGFGRPSIVTGMMPGMGQYRPRGRFPGPPAPRPVQAGGSIVRGSSMLRQNTPVTINNFMMGNAKKPSGQPSISITPLPRQPAPAHAHAQAGSNSKGTFVICEICDGYIKDLDQLRNHMQWIHKVKIHPKMIYNRPPLNCQKCQFRFFTDQGLERHLLGSHGLVTSSMQEAANKSKDAGRCPVCGKVYQWKLLNHVARDHNLTLKPAHLSYKCTVCTATFGMYKLFENHVYSAHSVVAKRVMDKNIPKAKSNTPKGLKINDEITITAQPAKFNKDK